jgi:hypothetical protein
LTDDQLVRVGWRLDEQKPFSTALPERTLKFSRRWQLCIVLADEALRWGAGEFVLDEDAPSGPAVVAVARIRSSPRPTTTDDRIMVAEPTIIDPLPLRDLVAGVPTAQRTEVRRVTRRIAGDLSPAAAEVVVEALLRERPDLGPTVRRLTRGGNDEVLQGAAGEVLVLERDAVRVALSIAGVNDDPLDEWDGSSEGGFLASLAYDTPEDMLVAHDPGRFPEWDALPGGRPDGIDFTNGRSHVRVGNVNHTKLENVLGVDLIYRHIEANTTVLVQYKRMRRDGNGNWFYRPDAQLEKELARMRKVDRQQSTDDSPQTWRLYPRGCLLKLVRQPREFDPRSDRLLSGIYLPLEYLDELLADDSTLTDKGARRLGYDTIDRYLTNGLFVALVRQGWIGTRGLTTRAVATLIDAAVGAGKSVLLAEESSDQSGAERRQPPTRT